MKFNACSREPKDTSGPEPDLPVGLKSVAVIGVMWSLFQNS